MFLASQLNIPKELEEMTSLNKKLQTGNATYKTLRKIKRNN